MSIASIPSIFYEFAFNADPNQNTLPPYWTDLSSRVQYGWTLTRGRQYELDVNEAGVWKVDLANADGALDPGNASSPYSPNVLPYRRCRIRIVLGNNLLSPDLSTAGEWSPWVAGPLPAASGAGSAFPLAVASVGVLAYQGTRVYAVTVPGGTSVPADVLTAQVQQVTAGQTYTFSVQTQAMTSGQNPGIRAVISWLGTAGQVLSTTNGSPSTLTGAAGTWTQISVTGAAPAAAVAAVLRVSLSTAPAGANTVWVDALQLEARGYATRFQMPWTPGVNLLPQTIATGTETMNQVTDQVANWFFASGGTLAQSLNLATAAPSGQTTGVAWTLPAGAYGASPGLYAGFNPGSPAGAVADCCQVAGSGQYTASVYVTRAGSDPTVNLTGAISWFDSTGTFLTNTTTGVATAVSTSGWTRVSVTGTAPATAVWGRPFFYLSTSPLTSTEVLTFTGLQVEKAAAASVWADPGPSTYLFNGFVERWPRTWTDLSATYGTSKLQCVDATAAMSQNPLLQPFVQEVLSYSPNFFYQLNDTAGSTACADTAGRRVPAPVENSPYGAGGATFGSSITSTSPSASFVGTAGPVVTFNNNPAGSGQHAQLGETFVSIHKTANVPGPPPAGNWTRAMAFRAPTVPATGSNAYTLWSSLPASYYVGNSAFQVSLANDGTGLGQLSINLIANDGSSLPWSSASPATYADGNWHQVVVTLDSSGNAAFYVDGQSVATGALTAQVFGLTSDVLGASVQLGAGYYRAGHVGDMADIVEIPSVLTAAQVLSLYNSWRSASAGESSGARYARILRWIGYPGATSIAAGSTQAMGPATDTVGQTPKAALDQVAATENGDSFVSSSGAVTFSARSTLYGVRTPVAVFGEGPPVGNTGEWPAEIGAIDYDPAHLANTVQVTQYQGPIYTGRDATSARRYFPRTYQRTVNVAAGSEAQDAANYLLSQLKDPRQRANAIRLHPSAIVGLFPVVAQIDKTSRIRYIKRPVGAASTTIDAFVQRIAWTCSPDSDMFVEYQASPADLLNYWRAAALHTTLSAQASAGQANATINALPDAAVNKLAQSMPSAQTLWFEPGTPRFESVTVQTIPSTSLGYSTATLTMTSNFSFTHPIGSVVCEPLPTGYTDPTTWDTSSILAASYAPVLAGGGSGTATVTIGPLPDAGYNAVAQTWNQGDTLWLSPGTANFETATVASVATTYPGYTSCTITLTANLVHSHAVGDWVCDPLPAGATVPSAIGATSRVAY